MKKKLTSDSFIFMYCFTYVLFHLCIVSLIYCFTYISAFGNHLS